MSSRKPRLALPPGATDCHMHVYHAEAPPAPGGPALPGDFREDAYRAMRQRLGLTRVIVVQPNAYQDDNRVALAAIRTLGPGARGVAVVKPGVTDAEIERLAKGGMVAQRIFQLPWGAVGFEHMHEVMARGGKVVLISDRKGLDAGADRTWASIEVPEADPFITPLIYALPIQLLAYHTAVAKGTDVDQPRNLAKSVTVE